jgi:hypothetical protein
MNLLKNKKLQLLSFTLLIIFFSFLSFNTKVAHAATLYINPSSGNFSVGNIFTVNILVNTQDVSVNNAEALLNFPKDLLEIVSISKSGSIFSLWVEEPVFSNSSGTLSFNGGVPTPGFTGFSGKALSVVFRVKKIGSASVIFSSASVRANDGYGTDVLTGTGPANFNLSKAVEKTPTPIPSVIEKPKTTAVSGTFSITEIERDDLTDPRASFKLDAKYESPGVDHYEVQINEGEIKTWEDDNTNIYQTEVLSYGTHIITIKAFDQNNKFLTDSATFVIKALETPVITKYDSKITNKDIISIVGRTTYDGVKVKIILISSDNSLKNYETETDQNGNFRFSFPDKLVDGSYFVQAQIIDTRGATSELSKKIEIIVSPTQLTQLGFMISQLLSVIVPILALILLFIFIIWYTWRKFAITHKKLNRKIIKIEYNIHKAFDLLKEDVQDQVRMLEHTRTKRQLTAEEEKIIRHFREDLEDTEKFIKKELENWKK